MNNTEIRFTGFGGQGIILAAHITGRAVTIYENLNATLTQSYGPESRGGSCSAQLIISDKPIYYPHLTQPDVLVALSPEGYAKYKGEVKPGGAIIVEENILCNTSGQTAKECTLLDKKTIVRLPVKLSARGGCASGAQPTIPGRIISAKGGSASGMTLRSNCQSNVRTLVVPAVRLAEEVGKKVVTNMVVLGFMVAATKVVSKEAMRQAIADSVPPGTQELNLAAFDKGYNHYKQE
jgi:2-oxoglutarate ferredoxin oxidoreductase subunit gamma